jgi:SAM-dependent methyltransferase
MGMTEQNRTPIRLRDWNWFDPSSTERFTARVPIPPVDTSTEIHLQNIIRLADRIFDHLSVFEQFCADSDKDRAGSHAVADPARRVDIPGAKAGLRNIEQGLWNLYTVLKDRQTAFVQQQLQALGIDEQTRGLKVHIGSAGYMIEDWLNIDAGGGDLTLNVNWGLQLPDGSAQFAYCSHLLEHLRYSDQAPVFVREIHRILATGGTVRLVVPDLRKLLSAYVERNREFFDERQRYYLLHKGFTHEGIATLDYILLFAGAAPQVLSYNHKFGYDASTLRRLLLDAGFSTVVESEFMQSHHAELCVDAFSYNTQAQYRGSEHYSLFIEATK